VLPYVASNLGYAYALAGRLAEALPLLEEAVEQADLMGHLANQSIRIAYLSEGYLLAGRISDAFDSAQRGLTLARMHAERGHEAWSLRLLGEIASRRDPPEIESAEQHFLEALALASTLGMRPLVAHSHLGLGKVHRGTRRREQALEHLTSAAMIYRQMGMRFLLEKADTELKDFA
jgi:tetratricopeptide (TPR) repeat protein